ncbi:MOZ/SAS family protein [Ancylostoma duodenale]|uniref:Histone acetyltransferase n=1 Tax=Ancylostoma duodenale TaxID=51022 RepID=A0A0C2DM19_9BILA|nr:MOZ/SAS family protein [Ancylostoma duodenale]
MYTFAYYSISFNDSVNSCFKSLVVLLFDFASSVMGEPKAAATNETERTATRMDDVKINERVVVWRVVNGERRRVLATLLKKRNRVPKSESNEVNGEKSELETNAPTCEVVFFFLNDSQSLKNRLEACFNFLDVIVAGGGDTRLTRKRRKNDDELVALDDAGGRGDQHRKPPPEKNIERVIFGGYEIQCWYYSPYRLKKKSVERLYVCENCLLYTDDVQMYACHLAKDCERASPPGVLIYEEGDVQIYEVFGALQKFYCQRLCLLAKLFIDHKTLCFDVENFIFYLLCEKDKDGAHIAAMFSKEMHSSNNLACIMTLPCYQRKGYGNLLIQLSEFTREMLAVKSSTVILHILRL